jgi:hypothetical protein
MRRLLQAGRTPQADTFKGEDHREIHEMVAGNRVGAGWTGGFGIIQKRASSTRSG